MDQKMVNCWLLVVFEIPHIIGILSWGRIPPKIENPTETVRTPPNSQFAQETFMDRNFPALKAFTFFSQKRAVHWNTLKRTKIHEKEKEDSFVGWEHEISEWCFNNMYIVDIDIYI